MNAKYDYVEFLLSDTLTRVSLEFANIHSTNLENEGVESYFYVSFLFKTFP